VLKAYYDAVYSTAASITEAISNHNVNTLHKQATGITQTGSWANAEGGNSTASGNYSHAEGYNTSATSFRAHAEGNNTTASYDDAHAEGNGTTASGISSHSEGYQTIANVSRSHAQGTHNKTLTGSAGSYSGTADAFVIGNGTSLVARANAFRVTFDGKTYGLSAFNSTGADYAEFFEWLDGNPGAEDRVGYFVTLDGEKIRKAAPGDTYILGIVSARPTVVGDSFNDAWYGMYLRDEWGRIQYENVTVAAATDEDGSILEPERTDYVPQLNPEWDNTQTYIPREARPEWATVGMMGKLLVWDDGSCAVNGYCVPGDNGIAAPAAAGYRVMARVSDNQVKILIK
jgi:hypothetical protein